MTLVLPAAAVGPGSLPTPHKDTTLLATSGQQNDSAPKSGAVRSPNAVADELAQQVAELHSASFSWALVCCRGRADEAEDVLQTVYCKIVDGRARFAGRARLKTWLFSVIRRTAADRARRHRLRRLLFESNWRNQPSGFDDSSTTPETLVLAGDRRQHVRRALGTLSQRQRQVLELVFYHDLSVQQAADVLGMRIGTARVHYQRGKERLASHLAKEPNRA